MTPMTRDETIAVLDDALAFTKAASRAGIKEADARRLLSVLAELPAEQLRRICTSALEQRRATEARLSRRMK